MLKLFAKCFEIVCSILAIINFVVLGTAGGIFGDYIAERILYENPTGYIIVFVIIGLILAFFINVLTFGLIAQITEIRKNLEKLNSK